MKTRTDLHTLSLLGLMLLGGRALAQETGGEKLDAAGNGVKRTAKRGANRVKEAACTGTKAECEVRKAGHRIEEGKDTVVDKAKEAKDKAD
jgi:hypothetical protein